MSSSVIHRASPGEGADELLSFTFQVCSVLQAADLAAELRTLGAEQVSGPALSSRMPCLSEWVLAPATPRESMSLALVGRWEAEMAELERRRPGCRFLGWRTIGRHNTSTGCKERETGRDRACAGGRSQRELVIASLLRCPPSERVGIVHGRAATR